MSEIRFCPRCGKNVLDKAKINWVIFIVLLILTVIVGLVYLVYCVWAKEKVCSVCGFKPLEPARQNAIQDFR
ncbi:MAG: hypothetical protein LBG62_01940 [Candidatus Methanoplasma sp.]|jgi:ribosomal protein L37E|nr:hypothetical protein [Candidatus Methanoplasma sp.]